jgi:hypothetical protein
MPFSIRSLPSNIQLEVRERAREIMGSATGLLIFSEAIKMALADMGIATH